MSRHPLQHGLLALIGLTALLFYLLSVRGDALLPKGASLVWGWLPGWVLALTVLLGVLSLLSLLWAYAPFWASGPEGRTPADPAEPGGQRPADPLPGGKRP